jgi:nucleoside-diphosphate-sugar epimerase
MQQTVIRLVVDFISIGLAILAAITLAYFIAVGGEWTPEGLQEQFALHLPYFILMLLVAPAILLAKGIYSRVRVYTRRYKLRHLVQAMGWATLIVGLLVYTPNYAWLLLLLSLGLSIGLMSTTRFAAFIKDNGWSEITERLSGIETPKKPDLPPEEQHILVIGGAGYIGSILTRLLVERGYNVRVLDWLFFGDNSLADLKEAPNFDLMIGDFRHPEPVSRAMKGMDTVIHLGGLVGDPACKIDEQLSDEINLIATKNIAEIAKGNGVRRFIFASSCSVYGASDEILNEQSDLNPLSIYARTKIDAEKFLLPMQGPDFAPVILRFATIFGLSPRPRLDLIINQMTANALFTGKFTVGGGDQWRPMIHVEDVARGVLAALEAPEAAVKGEIFNVGDDSQNYTIAQMGEMVHKAIPQAEKIVSDVPDTDKRNYRVSFAKIRRILNYKATKSVDAGIAEIKKAIEAGTITSLQNPIYNNNLFLRNVYDLPVAEGGIHTLGMKERMVYLNGVHVGKEEAQLNFVHIRPGETIRRELLNGADRAIYYLYHEGDLPDLKLELAKVVNMLDQGRLEEGQHHLKSMLQTIRVDNLDNLFVHTN